MVTVSLHAPRSAFTIRAFECLSTPHSFSILKGRNTCRDAVSVLLARVARTFHDYSSSWMKHWSLSLSLNCRCRCLRNGFGGIGILRCCCGGVCSVFSVRHCSCSSAFVLHDFLPECLKEHSPGTRYISTRVPCVFLCVVFAFAFALFVFTHTVFVFCE